MNILEIIDALMEQKLANLKRPTLKKDAFDMEQMIYQLAVKKNWRERELTHIKFILKKMNLGKKIFSTYDKSERKTTDNELDNEYIELIILVMIRYIFLDHNTSKSIFFRNINSLYKMLDIHSPAWIDETGLMSHIETKINQICMELPETDAKPLVMHVNSPPIELTHSTFKTIPLTVLFYEGPIARSYLATLKSLGFKPQKIINLISANDLISKKAVGKFLPKTLRKLYAYRAQQRKIHFWPKRLAMTFEKLVDEIFIELEKKLDLRINVLKEANHMLPLSVYSDSVVEILIDDLNDPVLYDVCMNELASAFLFTGGGIVPAKLLDIPKHKFIHIHPGYLPDFRGADCTLWSSFLTGQTSASCFYMSPGIDDGDVIIAKWLPNLVLKEAVKSIETKTRYRLIYSFVDPWVRSFVLRELVSAYTDFLSINAVQQQNDGTMYYFMHDKMKALVFRIC